MRNIIVLFLVISFLLPGVSLAQKDPDLRIETQVDGYIIRHVVFNSTFVLPEIAAIHNIKRSKFESLLNVSVTPEGQIGTSIPAEVSGTITNLMQQQKVLKLKEIREPTATYYIAPVRVANEELLRFELRVKPEGSDKTFDLNFTQTVYADE